MKSTLTWNGDKVVAQIEGGSVTGVKNAAGYLLGRARPLAPLDKGDLRSSGEVVMDGVTGKVEFGGAPPKGVIAVVQHERMDFRHPQGGQAKYLQQPMVNEATVIFRIISDEIQK